MIDILIKHKFKVKKYVVFPEQDNHIYVTHNINLL